MMRNEKYAFSVVVSFFLLCCFIAPELFADGWPPTVSILSPNPGTSASPEVVSLSGTNTVRVLVQVWDDLAITGNSVYVDYSTDKSAWTAVGPAALNTNYPNAANMGVYEVIVSGLTAGNTYYLRARAASADGTGYSSDRRTMVDANNDPRYVCIKVLAFKSGTGKLLARDASGQLCMDCHNLQTHSSQSTDTGYQNWAIICGECHTAHNTHNIMLVTDAIVTPNSGPKSVKFYNRTGDADNSFVDSSPPAGTPNGVCQVCHTRTMNSATLVSRWRTTGNDDSHYTTAVGTQACTSCHPHSVGFKGSCISCHGYPPVDNASLINGTATFGATGRQTQTAPGAGAHNKHYNVKGYACEACHTGGGATGNHNKLTTPALVHIGFNFLSGSYQSGTYTTPDFTNADYDLAAGNGGTAVTISGTQRICSNFYCHSKGQSTSSFTASNAAYSTAIWEGSMPADCAGCHGNDTASANLISSGSHTKHLNADNTCTNCHVATVSGNRAIGNESNHVNNLINIAFNSTVHSSGSYSGSASPMTKSPGSAYASCTNIRCHNDGKWIWFNDTSKKMGNTPVWGSAGGCSSCHGSTATYTNYRAAAPQYTSYPTDTTSKPNAHVYHVDVRDSSSDGSTGTGTQCKHCHVTTTTTNISTVSGGSHLNDTYSLAAGTQTYRKWTDGTGSSQTISMTYSFNATTNTSTCSNVSCHPETTATKWSDAYSCLDCHNIDMTNTTGYHHAMNASQLSVRSYPTSTPSTTASSDTARTCVMCHADHDIFSTMLNASSSGRAYNLRTDITVTPTKSGGFTNTDFDNALTNGGICVSCHLTELSKNTANTKDDGTTKTVSISKAQFSASNHNYMTSSAFTTPTSGNFNANCSKCHIGDNDSRTFQNTSNKFKLHDDKAKRLLASLGATSGTGTYDYKENYEEGFCYRCHSTFAQAATIGGTAKSAANYDWYGSVTNMNAASQDILTSMQRGTAGTAEATTSTDTLYLKNTQLTGLTAAYILASGTYAGTNNFGTQGMPKELSPNVGASAANIAQAESTTANRYYRFGQYITPPLKNAVNYTTAQSFTLYVQGAQSTTAMNPFLRYSLYRWDSATSTVVTGTPLKAVTQSATELGNNIAITKYMNTLAFTPSNNVTFNANDRIILEIEGYENTTNGGTITVYYGDATDNSRLVLPGTVDFITTPATSAAGRHDVASYSGKHKPSPTDETRAYIAADKHVECADCHDPHEAKAGLHTKGTNTLANVLTGASLVSVTTWSATNWGGVVTWNPAATTSSLLSATSGSFEWQVCFKCHSSANANYASWGGTGATSWTDLGLEFNPNNESRHPVVSALPSSGAQRGLAAGAMTGGWSPGQVMTCSDCHATDSAASKGPHGSSVKWMLNPNTTGTKYYNWPYTSAAMNGSNSSTATDFVRGTGTATVPANNFCFSCHVWSGGGGAHTGCNSHTMACVGCHIRVPHGGKMVRLLTSTNVPARYRPSGITGGYATYLGSVTKPAAGTIGMGDCEAAGGCTAGEHPGPEASSW